MYKKLATAVLCTAIGVGQALAQNYQKEMMEDLQFIANRFKTNYAPVDWKKEYFQWDVDAEVLKAQDKIFANENITVNDYQKILKDFIDTTKDYHVGYYFYHTERAKLHFTVKSADGKYFLAYIDRAKLPESAFPFHEGDELVEFDHKPVSEALKELYNEESVNVKETDLAIAELRLTSRAASSLVPVPYGAIDIGVKPKGSDTVVTRQLMWTHENEKIQNHLANEQQLNSIPEEYRKLMKFVDFKMEANKDISTLAANPYGLGNRDSFIPELGHKEWQSDDESIFQAYTYKLKNGKKAGYLRIPSYSRDFESMFYGLDLTEFAEVINKFEKETDVLVIDQLNNPGGSVFYLYGLASMLTNQPLKTPRHEMTLTQADVLAAHYIIQDIDEMAYYDIPEYFVELLSNIIGYPFSDQFMQFEKNYAEFLISEWNAGKVRTSPYHIAGVDHVNPSAKAQYTKPIVILTNNLDFSGGDFFPAIMQDNNRAKVVGTRTAGAGGYVLGLQYPNIFGLAFISYTGSIAERVSKDPIENLGVKPDHEIKFTANDLQYNYEDYIKSVNDYVVGLTDTKVESKA